MAEYIEREAAQKVAERYGCTNGAALGRHSGLADCIASEIEALPPADVAPVRHGHWLKGRYGECTCSNCMMGIQRKADGWKTEWVDLSGIPFCPACGAKMDGGDASENQTTEAGET